MIIKDYNGLTLTELLISVAILTITLSGILLLFTHCVLLSETNHNLATAAAHAQYIMEGIKNTDFSQIEPNINNGVWDLNAAAIASSPYNLTPLTNETIDTEVVLSGDPLGIRVNIDWTDRGTRARNKVLETIIKDIS